MLCVSSLFAYIVKIFRVESSSSISFFRLWYTHLYRFCHRFASVSFVCATNRACFHFFTLVSFFCRCFFSFNRKLWLFFVYPIQVGTAENAITKTASSIFLHLFHPLFNYVRLNHTFVSVGIFFSL